MHKARFTSYYSMLIHFASVFKNHFSILITIIITKPEKSMEFHAKFHKFEMHDMLGNSIRIQMFSGDVCLHLHCLYNIQMLIGVKTCVVSYI